MNIISSICKKNADSYDIGINSADLFGVALRIPSIVQKVIIRYVHALIRNFISGRTAVYCISFLQSFLLESMRTIKIGELTLVVDICSDIANLCLNALTADNCDKHTEPSLSVSYIDLIPTVVNTLSRIEQSDLWKKVGVCGGARRNHVEILSDICTSHWPAQLVLPLANVMAELWMLLLPRHISSFKVLSSRQFLCQVLIFSLVFCSATIVAISSGPALYSGG